MPKLKVPDAANVPLIEVGVMTYPDCQMGMVHGITDLFDVAGRFAVDHGRRPLRVSHWHLQEGGGFARWYDSHPDQAAGNRSEEHTSELQSLMRSSYAVFCLKKKKLV